jgi:ketol-acid reductoisomerase
MTARRRLNAEHPIEQTGEQLRSMMPWIKKIIDKNVN